MFSFRPQSWFYGETNLILGFVVKLGAPKWIKFSSFLRVAFEGPKHFSWFYDIQRFQKEDMFRRRWCMTHTHIDMMYIYIYVYLEPGCPLFWGFNPPQQGLFQFKHGSFGFQAYTYLHRYWFLRSGIPTHTHTKPSVFKQKFNTCKTNKVYIDV